MFPELSRKTARLPGKTLSTGAIFLLWSSALIAVQTMPLPTFSVQTLDGQTVQNSSWPTQGKRLLIYVESPCQPCSTVLRTLTKQTYPHLASRAIVVVGGLSPSDAGTLQKQFPDLAGAAWYADPAKNLSSSLKLQGAPVIFGIQDGMVRWSISGIPPDAKQFRSALNTWCTQ